VVELEDKEKLRFLLNNAPFKIENCPDEALRLEISV